MATSDADPVVRFVDFAASQPAISAEEERALFARLRGPVAASEPVAELARADADALDAWQRILVGNLGLVASVVRPFARRHPQLRADLLQEGTLGLCRAVRHFDPRRGVRFRTYARWWVFHCVQHAQALQESVICLPANLHECALRLRRTNARFALARPAAEKNAASEYARQLGVSRQTAAMLLARAEGTLSLERDRVVDADGREQDVPLDTRNADPVQRAAEHLLAEAVASCLARLDPPLRQVLELRFGFDGTDELALSEVGARFGKTGVWAGRLLERALAKLRIGARGRLLEVLFLEQSGARG